MNKKILVLYGHKGVGKSTIASELSARYKWHSAAFADPIRSMLAGAFGTDFLNKFTDKESPRDDLGGKSIRQAMMTLGTEWGREMIYPNIWVDCTIKRIKNWEWASKIVIDDARFNNEYEALKKLGAKFVKVLRDGVDPIDLSHSSEQDWPLWIPDLFVVNENVREVAQEIDEWFQHESN